MNLQVIGKIHLHDLRFDDIETNLRSNQSNDLFSAFAFNLSKVIFFGYSYFLLVCPLSVLFACLTFSCSYFLIKRKVRFCFIVARNNLTTHTANYRMNDVTMIHRILI